MKLDIRALSLFSSGFSSSTFSGTSPSAFSFGSFRDYNIILFFDFGKHFSRQQTNGLPKWADGGRILDICKSSVLGLVILFYRRRIADETVNLISVFISLVKFYFSGSQLQYLFR